MGLETDRQYLRRVYNHFCVKIENSNIFQKWQKFKNPEMCQFTTTLN